MNRQYPCLEVHLDRLTHNAQEILSRCRAQNIQVCGIIKGCGGMPQVAQVMRQNGAAQIGIFGDVPESSTLQNRRSAPAVWSRWHAAAPQAWTARSC